MATHNKEVGENLVEQLSSRKGNMPRKRPSMHERKISQSNSENSNQDSESNIGMTSFKAPVMSKEKDKSLYELIEYLWNNADEEKEIVWLLLYIAAIEDDEYITGFIRQRTKNFIWYYYPRGLKQPPYEVVINDLRILNETLNYSLKLRSLSLIEYILKGAEDLFINGSITEEQILPLLINQADDTCQKILKFIVTKDVIIVNDGSLKLDDSLVENYHENEEIIYGSLGESK